MKKRMVLLAITALMSTHLFAAEPAAIDIAGTSFENEALGTMYYDTLDTYDPSRGEISWIAHDMINNPNQSHVNSTASSQAAGDLGFSAYHINTRLDQQGMLDGANIGVVTSTIGFPDGTQGYAMGNSDGRMKLTFDSVDLTNYVDKQFSIHVNAANVGWETSDFIRIALDLTGGPDITLIDSTGIDIDLLKVNGHYLTGSWKTLSADIPDTVTSAVLIIEMDSDGTTEIMYLDDIRFTGTIPEPASLTIMALGTLAAIRRKRNR